MAISMVRFTYNYLAVKLHTCALDVISLGLKWRNFLSYHVTVNWTESAVSGILFLYRGVQERGGTVCQELPAHPLQPVHDGARKCQGHDTIGGVRNH